MKGLQPNYYAQKGFHWNGTEIFSYLRRRLNLQAEPKPVGLKKTITGLKKSGAKKGIGAYYEGACLPQVTYGQLFSSRGFL